MLTEVLSALMWWTRTGDVVALSCASKTSAVALIEEIPKDTTAGISALM